MSSNVLRVVRTPGLGIWSAILSGVLLSLGCASRVKGLDRHAVPVSAIEASLAWMLDSCRLQEAEVLYGPPGSRLEGSVEIEVPGAIEEKLSYLIPRDGFNRNGVPVELVQRFASRDGEWPNAALPSHAFREGDSIEFDFSALPGYPTVPLIVLAPIEVLHGKALASIQMFHPDGESGRQGVVLLERIEESDSWRTTRIVLTVP